jgi:hypothetical protein
LRGNTADDHQAKGLHYDVYPTRHEGVPG